MTIDQVVQLQRTQPFRPYRVHLADGRSFDIEHPEFLAHSRGGRTIVVFTGDEGFEIIDLLLVTSLGVIDGRPERRKRSSR